jgi:predicted dehydrogenase
MYTKEIEAFSEAVINDTEPPVNGRNTILVQKVIDAIYNNNGGKL